MNVYVAIHEGVSSFKLGMVLRNDGGIFMAGKQVSIEAKVSILEAEATGVQEAMHWIRDLGIRNVVVENDSLTVVNALLRNTEYVSEVDIIIFESCRLFLKQRNNVKVQHVRQQANRVAHSIAKLFCASGTVNIIDLPPPCVLEHIVSDYSF